MTNEKFLEKLSQRLERPRLCIDCKWFKSPWYDRLMGTRRYGRCARPRKERLSAEQLVDGKTNVPFALNEREDFSFIDTCGSLARYWETKC